MVASCLRVSQAHAHGILKLLAAAGNVEAPAPLAPDAPATSLGIPPVKQPDGTTCGPAAVLATLRYAGYLLHVSVKQAAKMVGTNRGGTNVKPMVKFLSSFNGVSAEANGRLTYRDIEENAKAGKVAIVCLEAYPGEDPPLTASGKVDWAKISYSGHYCVVVAANQRGVWLMDPSMGLDDDGAMPRGFIPRQEFCTRFYDPGVGGGSSIVVTLQRQPSQMRPVSVRRSRLVL